MKEKIIPAIAILGLIIGGWALLKVGSLSGLISNGEDSFGATAAGNMLAENYIPYIMYNGGYNSAKDINTSAFLGGTGTFQFGSSGTTITRINSGTCFIDPYAATIAATTSVAVDCQGTAAADASGSSALTGVTLADFVVATLSTTTAGVSYGGLVIAGASASTTAGHIQLIIENLTGTTYTWSVSTAASGTVSFIAIDI